MGRRLDNSNAQSQTTGCIYADAAAWACMSMPFNPARPIDGLSVTPCSRMRQNSAACMADRGVRDMRAQPSDTGGRSTGPAGMRRPAPWILRDAPAPEPSAKGLPLFGTRLMSSGSLHQQPSAETVAGAPRTEGIPTHLPRPPDKRVDSNPASRARLLFDRVLKLRLRRRQ